MGRARIYHSPSSPSTPPPLFTHLGRKGALRADAAESAVCGYLALIVLADLVLKAVWKVSWADPVAALDRYPIF